MKTGLPTCLTLAMTMALSACATVGVLPITGNGATMAIQTTTESTGSIMKYWSVSAYEDERCEKEEQGVDLARGKTLDPITLPTDRKVTLTFGYSEVRLGAGAGCVYSVAFAPVENPNYTARFAIVGDTMSCKAELSDASGQPVKVTIPQQACMSGVVALGRPNGQGSYSASRPVQVMSR